MAVVVEDGYHRGIRYKIEQLAPGQHQAWVMLDPDQGEPSGWGLVDHSIGLGLDAARAVAWELIDFLILDLPVDPVEPVDPERAPTKPKRKPDPASSSSDDGGGLVLGLVGFGSVALAGLYVMRRRNQGKKKR